MAGAHARAWRGLGEHRATRHRVSATASSRSTSSRGAGGGVDDDATSGEVTTRWQLRKLEEARAGATQGRDGAREGPTRPRARRSYRVYEGRTRAPTRPLDDLDPADAMGRLDDVPLSDAEPEDGGRHDHLPPMERAMRRASEPHRARR